MNKYVKYTVVYLYCIFFVCSFLPAKFVFPGGFELLGSEFLFSILNGTSFASGWQISLLGLLCILTGLFATLFFAKKLTTIYINIGINFVFSIFYIISLMTSITSNNGVEICLVISALILIINVFSYLVFKPGGTKRKSRTHSTGARRTVKNTSQSGVRKVATTSKSTKSTNELGAYYCKNCGKLLFSNEVCNCTSHKQSTSNPVKISKCARCGRTLFGSEKCNCNK